MRQRDGEGVVRLDRDTMTDVLMLNGTVRLTSMAVLRLDDGRLGYDVVSISPFLKRYGHDDQDDLGSYIDVPNRAAFVAWRDGRIAGYVTITTHWNRYAWIGGLVVDAAARRHGVGRALMTAAEAWTRQQGLPGIMLETQNVNVAACRFYERCGFTLSGFDQRLYRGFDPDTIEVALFWYRDLSR